MQSFGWIALLAVLAGVHGSSYLPTVVYRNIGEDFELAVPSHFEVVDKCYITTPTYEEISFKPIDASNEKYEKQNTTDAVGCRVRVRNLDAEDSGLWRMTTQSVIGTRRSQSYQVTVHGYSTENESSDYTTTGPPDEIKVIYLDKLYINTKLGTQHRIEIPYYDFVETERCYIENPQGFRFDLATQNISGIETIHDPNVACGVVMRINSEAQLREWMLISREIRYSHYIYERRLLFSIEITEEVQAIPNEIYVFENKDIYVRLLDAIPNPDTCKLLRPDGSEPSEFIPDSRFKYNCGFIVRGLNESDSGTWRIVYGDGIIYTARIQVTVQTNGGQGKDQIFIWTRDKPVHQIVGSENAIYCKVTDPRDFVVFQGFGRCNITLPRATDGHEGTWKVFVGIRGRVLTEQSVFTVRVVKGLPKAEVDTSVEAANPRLTLSCSVSSPYSMNACKFRDPSGRILMANPGVGEDRYSFHGKGSSYKSGVFTHDCGIQISDPVVRDLGLWRCALETTNETYFGFLNAWAPWVTKDPEVVAGIMRQPMLIADNRLIRAVGGDSVLMSCSVRSAIRYCYFRSNNGTVYNVGPEFSSSDMAGYAGAGLDAGECSIRFRSLTERDGGYWTCHVGFTDQGMAEQNSLITVHVNDIMRVTHSRSEIWVDMLERRPLEYCRFVRSDGYGFTHERRQQWPYEIDYSLERGVCVLRFLDNSIENRFPWTVVVKLAGHSQEITRTTNGVPLPPPPVAHFRLQTLWIVLLVSGILMIVLGTLVTPKKNRDWTYAKAASIRNSFRQRFAKNAAADTNVAASNTANAA